jgi:nucleoside-diphosphate-sugar epimerase
MTAYPTRIETVGQLEDLLSEPSEAAVNAMKHLDGDVLLLGVGGKMGPTLARMVKRASDQAGVRRRVIGASRFSSPELQGQVQRHGMETIPCDLTNQAELDRLPNVPNVIYMAGMKFGATGNESLTWMMNVHVPAMVCRRFARSQIVAFSSGNVYGLTPVSRGGSVESDPLRPVGEYAMTAVGRERTFEHFSRVQGTPTVILRLNYANELRYGVLVDLAASVLNEEPIDLAMGYFNAIWQGDANAMALAAFDHLASPPRVLNIAGPEILSVREVAEEFGRRLGKRVTLRGSEAEDALLSNSSAAQRLFGRPRIDPKQMIEWIAEWIRASGANLGKPTHFENRAGDF